MTLWEAEHILQEIVYRSGWKFGLETTTPYVYTICARMISNDPDTGRAITVQSLIRVNRDCDLEEFLHAVHRLIEDIEGHERLEWLRGPDGEQVWAAHERDQHGVAHSHSYPSGKPRWGGSPSCACAPSWLRDEAST